MRLTSKSYIITCIESCFIDKTTFYEIGDKIKITVTLLGMSTDVNKHNGIYPKSKFLTNEELREYKIKQICK